VNNAAPGNPPNLPGPWLASRPLPRAGGESIAPLVWRIEPLSPGATPPLTILWAAIAMGGWVFVPADLPDADLRWVKEVLDARPRDLAGPVAKPSVVMGVRGEDLATRSASRVRERLAALGLASCAAVMREEADPIELKGGRPYQAQKRVLTAGRRWKPNTSIQR
jgi:hypothetical protein